LAVAPVFQRLGRGGVVTVDVDDERHKKPSELEVWRREKIRASPCLGDA